MSPAAPWEPAADPLRVRAYVPQQLVLRGGSLALDALLMAATAKRDRLPPPTVARGPDGALPDLAIPLARRDGVWLCSHAYPRLVEHETRYRNRRFPLREAARLTAMVHVNAGAGPQKSYRVPYSAAFVEAGYLEWHALGDGPAVRALLEAWVTGVGAHVGVGYGRVARWEVVPVAPWAGFPVLDPAGRPTRPLPLDWPGLGEHVPGYATLAPPYWDRAREDVLALPVPA